MTLLVLALLMAGLAIAYGSLFLAVVAYVLVVATPAALDCLEARHEMRRASLAIPLARARVLRGPWRN